MNGAGTERDWFCYMLRCKDGSLYGGIAQDVAERVKRHNWGVGPEFTEKRRRVELIWTECCGDCNAARRREREIKGWNRRKKIALVAEGLGSNEGFSADRRLALRARSSSKGRASIEG